MVLVLPRSNQSTILLGWDLYLLRLAIAKIIDTDELRPAARKSLAKLIDDFTRWRSMLDHTDHIELAGIVLDELAIRDVIKR